MFQIKLQQKYNSTARGFSLIEVVVGASLITATLIALVLLVQLYSRVSRDNTALVQGSFIGEEGMEGMRSIRDTNWNNIQTMSSSTPYYLSFNNNAFIATSTPNSFIDERFERLITVDDVYRDEDGVIVSSGGTLDPDTKKITATVSWAVSAGATTTQTTATYLTNS
jgi:Tfp pilus assembly protein PilV